GGSRAQPGHHHRRAHHPPRLRARGDLRRRHRPRGTREQRRQRTPGRGRPAMNNPQVDATKLAELAELVKELAVVHGRVTLSSGKEADYYVDLRRATLHHKASRLIGELLRQLTADWDYVAVGGLTLGADPVATSVMHAAGRPIDAF